MEAQALGSAPRRAYGSRRLPSRARRAWARIREFEREWSIAGPAVFVGIAAGLLIYNHVEQRVTEITFWLGLALLGAVFTWLLENNHSRARRDAVTGLGNRLQLNTDLGEPL